MGFYKKCDICGKAYEPYNIERNAQEPNGFSYLNIPNSTSLHSLNISRQRAFDCCPEHMIEIMNFIDSLCDERSDIE